MSTKEEYTAVFLKAAGVTPDQNTVTEYLKIFWFNFRPREDGGMRLTEGGFDFLIERCDLKTYKIDFPEDLTFTPQVLLWLDKFIKGPFYITKRSIIVFSEKTAFELYLFSGDVRKLGKSKAMAKNFAQEYQEEK
jgi:hypothetical protein